MKRVRISVEPASIKPPQAVIFNNKAASIGTTSFKLYGSDIVKNAPSLYAIGHTDKLEFVGESLDDLPVHYAVGIYRPADNTVKIHEAPMFEVGTTVKRLRNEASREIGVKNALSRKSLGEAFGTKKRRRQLQSREENEIDVGQDLKGSVLEAMNDTIDAIDGPTQDDHKMDASDRVIPAYNPAATQVDDIYPLEQTIPTHELNSINLNTILKLTSREELEEHLSELKAPVCVTRHIRSILISGATSNEARLKLKVLMYVAYMGLLVGLKDRDLKNLDRLLKNVPTAIAEGLKDKFTSMGGEEGAEIRVMSDRSKDMLFTHIFCLLLRINNWIMDPRELKEAYGLGIVKVTDLLKELGCRIDILTKAQKEALNVVGRAEKRARLALPFVLPQARMRLARN
ncbi:hypothetical protein SmJEL517_g03060 [Synchytrium microbalum]|uniref:DNA-directed RNA polymerase I subunit RPA49 n=1 Tax=Synchytrium microbalum TaxID=1806994 RepID=A0A507C9M1_9FUNG|nr:uncharacterized protein SmJEL517_g03060 [Synchytrium microbalum]TPX34243.1 hypothetical protein SmJEL517_g03060 [Synchytrium microbalum]